MLYFCAVETTNKRDVHLDLTLGVFFSGLCFSLLYLSHGAGQVIRLVFGRPNASFSHCSESAIKADWISFTGAY